MAAGYIGKISAVVTANTSDLTKKLNDAGQNTKRFSEGLNRSISSAANSAQNSLQKIFTPLQNIERRLQTSLKVPGLDLPLDKIRAAVSLTEQINKPLARVVSGFNGLSLEVQGAFLPALQRAQDQAVNLNLQLENTGKVSERSFAQAQRSIDNLIAAQNRLQQAQSLSAQSLSGNELQFSNPLLFQTLNASAATTRKAAALPATSLADGAIAKSVQALKQYQQAAIQAQGTLETLRLDPKIDPLIVESQERRLKSLTETARRAQEQLQRAIEVQGNIGASTQLMSTQDPTGRSIQQRLQDINRLNEALERQRLLQNSLGASTQLMSTQDPTGRSIQQRLSDIQAERDRRAAVAAAASLERSVADEIADAEERAAQSRRARLEIATRLLAINRQESELVTNQGLASDVSGRVRANYEQLLRNNQGASSPFMTTLDPSGLQVSQRILQNAVTQQLDDQRNAAETVARGQQELGRRIANGFLTIITEEEAAADTLQSRQQELGRRIANGFLNILTPAEAAADTFAGRRAIGARDFRRGFGGPGAAGIELGLDQTEVRRYTAELQVLQQSISRVSATARGPAVAAFDRYREAIARAFEGGTLSARNTQRELSRLQQQAVSSAAAVAGISTKTLSRNVSRAGDIGRAGLDNLALAANQAAFAIDDFFSATGGLDMKLRAVQNNVTQLGFIVGGTTGLFAALGVAIGTQLVIALGRAVGVLDDTAARQERLKKITEVVTDAQNSQAEAVNRLAEAYEQFSQRATSALSEVQQRQAQLRNEFRDIRDNQREQRGEQAAQIDPTLIRERNRQNELRQQLESAGPADRIPIQLQIRRSREAELARIAQIENDARILADGGNREGLRALLRINQRDIADARGRRQGNEGTFQVAQGQRDTTRLLGERATLITAARLLQDRESTASARILDGVTQQASALQQRASELNSQSIAEAIGTELAKVQFAFDTLQGFEGPGREVFLESLQRAADGASEILSGRLSDALTALQERAERSAEALKEFEASASRGDSIRQSLRPPEEQLTQAIEDIRASFERDVINGTGRPGDINRIRGEQDAAFAAFADQQRRQAAPALFALQDAVANAVLQGPSRQALNAADISTQQGTAELNRLLRGDDPARDQNLLELQKQTNELVKLNATLGAAGVAD